MSHVGARREQDVGIEESPPSCLVQGYYETQIYWSYKKL
jgi:hypothetical protein